MNLVELIKYLERNVDSAKTENDNATRRPTITNRDETSEHHEAVPAFKSPSRKNRRASKDISKSPRKRKCVSVTAVAEQVMLEMPIELIPLHKFSVRRGYGNIGD